jgi:hypothetical protein
MSHCAPAPKTITRTTNKNISLLHVKPFPSSCGYYHRSSYDSPTRAFPPCIPQHDTSRCFWICSCTYCLSRHSASRVYRRGAGPRQRPRSGPCLVISDELWAHQCTNTSSTSTPSDSRRPPPMSLGTTASATITAPALAPYHKRQQLGHTTANLQASYGHFQRLANESPSYFGPEIR